MFLHHKCVNVIIIINIKVILYTDSSMSLADNSMYESMENEANCVHTIRK